MIYLLNFLLFGADVPPPAEPSAPGTPETPVPEMIPHYEGAFLKMFLVLMGLIVGIFFIVWLLKKIGQGRWLHGNGNKSIKIVEKRPLSPKTMLYIIDVDGQQSVIAESQLEVKHLMNLESIEEPKS
jgi:flagellar biogenesis protein FliO